MPRTLGLSLLYFMLVFGAGFLLGPIRVLLLEPQLGTRTAELLEMPIMLFVIWIAAGWIAQRFAQEMPPFERLSIGILAVTGVVFADLAVGVFLRSMTVTEVFFRRDVVSGTAYYGLLVLCALMIWLQARQRQHRV
ncbi:hypothetical protein IQ250_08985 [Pseudanabaenaceae cyanobacterium LEGE 13415]|nr:hypothetical protein [Pseudanabaenaceae cyanobacterium LEGE 13415]